MCYFANRNIVHVSVVFLLTSLIYDCAPESGGHSAQTGGEQQQEKEMIFAMVSEPGAVDPIAAVDLPSALVQLQIFSGLVRLNEDLSVSPQLAESYTLVDDLIWRFNLRRGVMFHNGQELTADDVVFCLNRAFNAAVSKDMFILCESVTAVDRYTVEIKTTKPFPTLPNKLVTSPGLIYSREQFLIDDGLTLAKEPVGTGPFLFEKWVSGDRIELSAFDRYFKGRPKLDRIIIRIIPEAAALTIALETGEIDATNWLAANDIKKIAAADNLDYQITSASGVMLFGFNTRKPPFNDPQFRKIVSLAVNRADIVQVASEGYATLAKGFLPEGLPGAADFSEQLRYDPVEAKRLLQAGGYQGSRFTLYVNDSKERRDIALLLQSDLKEIGIEVDIEIFEWTAYVSKLRAGDHTAFVMGNFLGTDSDYALSRMWHSTDFANGVIASNYTLYNNALVDALIEEGAVTLDNVKSEQIYKQINQTLANEVPGVPLYFGFFNLCYNKKLLNMRVHRGGYLYVFDQVDVASVAKF